MKDCIIEQDAEKKTTLPQEAENASPPRKIRRHARRMRARLLLFKAPRRASFRLMAAITPRASQIDQKHEESGLLAHQASRLYIRRRRLRHRLPDARARRATRALRALRRGAEASHFRHERPFFAVRRLQPHFWQIDRDIDDAQARAFLFLHACLINELDDMLPDDGHKWPTTSQNKLLNALLYISYIITRTIRHRPT